MTFTAITDPILYLEGGPIYNMIASGAIVAGQCLMIAGPFEVKPATVVTTRFVGVAGYSAADNAEIQVLGPGNIVRCQTYAPDTCEFGDALAISGSLGRVSNLGVSSGNKIGVAFETQTSASGSVIVLLT
jgi:hypothetical protein